MVDRRLGLNTLNSPISSNPLHGLESNAVHRTDNPYFAEARSAVELIAQVVGAGSMCWQGDLGDAVFDTEQAERIIIAAMDRLCELGWVPKEDDDPHPA